MGMPFPGEFSFKYHPWTREMHDSTATHNVGMKSAQAAFTEVLLNKAFFINDVKKGSVLYLLPTTKDASTFSSARFDAALDLSPHLQNLYNDAKNVSMKRAGSAILYIRGARSRSQLKSIPAQAIFIDERDEMAQEMVRLALERTSGQMEKEIWEISTPSVEDVGIHKSYKISSQQLFAFKCPCCSRFIHLTPANLKVIGDDPTSPEVHKSYIFCDQCKGVLDHRKKFEFLADGIWVPQRDSEIRGWSINRLYSSTVTPGEMAIATINAQTDPIEEQELYNSCYGLPHTVAGARVTDADIAQCYGEFLKHEKRPAGAKVVTLGIDVGARMHYEVDEWMGSETYSHDITRKNVPKVLAEGSIRTESDIDDLIKRFGVNYFVIDANPELRFATDLCAKYYGQGSRCYYIHSIRGKDIFIDDDQQTVKIERTSWLELSLSRYKNRLISLPKDLSHEYKSHIKALAKIYRKDNKNETRSFYVNGADDHHAHARLYAELAFQIYCGNGINKTISQDT